MADKVTPFVQTLCQMERFGGRCTRIDHGTWEIVDISRWTEEQNLKLRSQFPSIEATVVTNRKSLSGFAVMLRKQHSSHVWLSLLLASAIVACNAAIAFAIMEKQNK